MFGFSYGVDKIQGRVGKYGCLVLSALYAMSMIEQKDVSCTNAVQSFQEKSECWRSWLISSTARSCILVLKSTHPGIFTHPNFNFRSPAICLVLSALYAMSMIEQKDVSCTNAVQSFQEKSECWRSYICWIYGYGYIYIYLLIYGYMTDICWCWCWYVTDLCWYMLTYVIYVDETWWKQVLKIWRDQQILHLTLTPWLRIWITSMSWSLWMSLPGSDKVVHLKHKDKQEAKTVVKLGVLSILIISYLLITCLFTCCVDFRDALLRKMRKRWSPVAGAEAAESCGDSSRSEAEGTDGTGVSKFNRPQQNSLTWVTSTELQRHKLDGIWMNMISWNIMEYHGNLTTDLWKFVKWLVMYKFFAPLLSAHVAPTLLSRCSHVCVLGAADRSSTGAELRFGRDEETRGHDLGTSEHVSSFCWGCFMWL